MNSYCFVALHETCLQVGQDHTTPTENGCECMIVIMLILFNNKDTNLTRRNQVVLLFSKLFVVD